MGALVLLGDFRLANLSLIGWAILIVVAAGVVAIVLTALHAFKIQVPQFVYHIAWILFVVVICVLAIKFIASIL